MTTRFNLCGTLRRAMSMLALGALAACNRSAESAARPTVALVVKTLNNQFFIDMEAGAKAAADSLGIELVVQAPEREIDVERQMQIVENLIQRKVKVLLLVPNGSKEIVPAIVKANAAKIPVVVVDTRVDAATLTADGAQVATFIGSDNEDGGRMAGAFLVERAGGTAKVAVLEGVPGHETADARLRGFRKALAGAPGMQIVASQPANMERDQAFNVTQNILQAHPDVTALFACNDVMALGALEAIAAAGKASAISVVGFDAQDDARKAITEKRMAATIAQNPREMGRLAVLTAMRLIKGETVPAEQPVAISLVK
ncbi:MAG: sugar ABC transporter substrate-binding protein [Gemmatimonadaceae bacterium]|nr:sugar ABC transporter substrate-binding protein [Gemmatimonadaceae bacterium]